MVWLALTPKHENSDYANQGAAITNEAVNISEANTPAPATATPVDVAPSASTAPTEQTSAIQPNELASDPETIFVTPVLESVPAFNTQLQPKPEP